MPISPSWKDLFRTAKENIDTKTRAYLLFGSIGMSLNALSTAFLAKSTKPILDNAFIQGEKEALIHACLTILGIFIVRGISEYISNISMEITGQRITNSLQSKSFSAIINADFCFFQKNHKGDLSSILINDVRIIKETILKTFRDSILNSLTASFLIFLMIRDSPFLTLMCAWILPLIFFLLKKIGKKVRDLSLISSRQSSDLQTFFYEIFHNIILVKSSGTKKQEIEKINKKLSYIEKNVWSLSKIRSAMHPIMEILGGLAIVTSILIGGWQVVQNKKTVGAFFSFIISVLFVYRPLKNLAEINPRVQEGLSSYQRLEEIILKAKTEREKASGKQKKTTEQLSGDISIQNLYFGYPDQEAEVISDLSCCIKEGCFSVLVGPSGSGKTTLLQLLMRLYDPTKGGIFWGTQNLKDICAEHLRKNISFVSQNNYLFEGSILYNISYGIKASKDSVVRAAKKAFAHEFIERLPHKYNTIIGSSGINLSGGQSQRIALSRAFLRNSRLILLDESTSALDSASEKKIVKSIFQLKKSGKTVLAIAHRPSIIRCADSILSMKNGSIKQQEGCVPTQ